GRHHRERQSRRRGHQPVCVVDGGVLRPVDQLYPITVDLVHPHHPVGCQTDRGGQPGPVGRDCRRVVTDMVTEVEGVEGRLRHAARPGGRHPSDANAHVPSIRIRRASGAPTDLSRPQRRMNGGTSTSSSSPPMLNVAPLVCTGTLTASTGSNSVDVSLPALAVSIRCAPPLLLLLLAAVPPTTGLRPGPASKPAAITVTRTSSPSESSMTVPKMMLASWWAASCTSEAASLISNRPRSLPPAIDISTPWAPSIDASRSGELIAISAAFSERPSPRAEPMPISAVPAPFMMLLTSAKSTLIRPGVVIRSVMPCTPLSSTSSALRNASISDTAASPIWSSR